jgi:hypothetical protein
MNLLWQDNIGSFFGPAPDASGGSTSFAGTDAAAGWLSQPLLWPGSDIAPSPAADLGTIFSRGLDLGMASLPSNGSGLLGQDMLWVEPGSGVATWQLADSGGNAGAKGVGNDGQFFAPGTIPSDVASLVWQEVLFGFEEISSIVNSSTLDATLNQILDLVWTATGGSGSPPVTLPHAPTNSFPDDLTPLSPLQLVWTDPSPLMGSPNGSQPPVTGNSPQLSGVAPASSFSALAPQQLVWTDPSHGAPPLLDGQQLTGVVPRNLLVSRS